VKRDVRKSEYSPLYAKTLQTALRTLLASELRTVGPRIIEMLIKHIVEICESYYADKETVRVGQVLWYAVDKNDPPTRGKTMSTTKLKKIALTMVSPEDITKVLERVPSGEFNQARVVRACYEADAQGAVLSASDLAMIFGYRRSRISDYIRQEEAQGKIVPRRGNVHDMGSTLTHKRIICYKHFVENKQTPEIARETSHMSKNVDKYLKDFSRVYHCYARRGMLGPEAAAATGLSLRLVNEYIKIIHDFGMAREQTIADD
jgi:hypothetical protein